MHVKESVGGAGKGAGFLDGGLRVVAREPESLADKLMLLYDGAAVAAQMDRSTGSAASAGEVAEVLVDGRVG